MKIKVQLDEGAKLPVKAHESDVGYDMHVKSCTIATSFKGYGLYADIDTGVHMQPEDGYWLMAVANSRIASKPWWLGNGVGIIDPGYTGAIRFRYRLAPNISSEVVYDYFAKGEVCGQIIVMKKYESELCLETLDATERGDGGFGSTAK